MPPEVRTYGLPPNVRVHWLAEGDHSFAPPKSSGRTQAENLNEAVAAILDFASAL